MKSCLLPPILALAVLLGGSTHLGAAPAGTAISYAVGGAWTLWVLLRGVKDFRVGAADLRPERSMLRRIVSLGVPNMLEGATMWATTSIGVTKSFAYRAGLQRSSASIRSHGSPPKDRARPCVTSLAYWFHESKTPAWFTRQRKRSVCPAIHATR
jgi:hypothetical protein